jgi:CBS domain containing-hemolysin-like protein
VSTLEALVIALVAVVAAIASFARESLRSLSRSRLDEACRRLRRQERFGVILRGSTDAFHAVELVSAVSVGVVAALLALRFDADMQGRNAPADWLALAVEGFVLAASFVLVLFALPWSLARVTGERFVAGAWPAIEGWTRLARPYVALVRRTDRFLHRLWGLREPGGSNIEQLTREIKSVVDLGYREGILASHARRMIERVIAMEEEDVAAIMTPRTDMDTIPADVPLVEARRLMLEAGHSRMPVVGQSTDDIVGILYAKDLLRHLSLDDGRGLALKDIVREPFYVPETTGIDKLLESMKRKRVHIAIVLDEYSGVAGLVTMEDVLEQIVGEIVDEYDRAEDTGIRIVGPGSIEVAPWVRLDDLAEQFGFDLPSDEDYDTIGGFIYAQFGRIPRKREVLSWKQLRLTVLDADKRRVHRIRIDYPAPMPVGPASAAAAPLRPVVQR